MSVEKLAHRYAKALFDNAQSGTNLETIFADTQVVQNAISDNLELQQFFKSPIIKSEIKGNVINSIFKDKVDKTTLSFIQLLVNKKREQHVSEILHAFEKLYNSNKGITKAIITTAVEIDSSTEDKIKKILSEKTGAKNMVITKKIDPAIIGGFVAQVADTVFDNSVATKLSKIANELIYN